MTDLARCTACDAEIRWVLTVGGKRMPLDVAKVPDGNVVPTIVDGQRRARVVTGEELPVEGGAWQSHHRTCPNAADFRRRKRAATPLCGICRTALDPVLAAAGETAHPTCGAPDDLRAAVAASLPARPADPEPTHPEPAAEQLDLMGDHQR